MRNEMSDEMVDHEMVDGETEKRWKINQYELVTWDGRMASFPNENKSNNSFDNPSSPTSFLSQLKYL